MTGSITVNSLSTTVVDIIVGSEDHNTLETAVIAAGLVDALSGEGPFTVFAPTDAAFDALPEGTLDAVLADMDLLTSILTHHVASGSVMSTDLSDGMMVTTLNGTELTVSINDNGVMIDNAMVTVADIMADNGVVHVINAVLIPEEDGCENDDSIIESAFNTLSTCEEAVTYIIDNYGYTKEEACALKGDMWNCQLFGGIPHFLVEQSVGIPHFSQSPKNPSSKSVAKSGEKESSKTTGGEKTKSLQSFRLKI